jgi:hypothetical protein
MSVVIDGTSGITTPGVSSSANIVMTAGGITFNANPGGGTQATLNDYEAGTYTPTVTATSGTITSYTASGSYTKIGRIVTVQFQVSITNNGTGSNSLNVSLPFASNASTPASIGVGRENQATGLELQVFLPNNSSTTTIFTYSNGYPGGTNYFVYGNITYITS